MRGGGRERRRKAKSEGIRGETEKDKSVKVRRIRKTLEGRGQNVVKMSQRWKRTVGKRRAASEENEQRRKVVRPERGDSPEMKE